MLRIIPSSSGVSAAAYYSDGLKREDYYSKDQEVPSKWHGRAAELLGLSGNVVPEQFASLVENTNPTTGHKLTPRRNSAAERVPGWDFNFHAPKSLSVLQGLTGDAELVRVFRESVAETMGEIEAMIATRVRLDGRQDDRITGNCLWAEFVHFTARPVAGSPDPHLHCHAYIFNATWDFEEARWKAAKVHDIKVNAPFFEALLHSRLAAKISGLGYSVRRTRNAWEIVGLDQPLLEKFSRRKAEVEAAALKLGITDPKEKAELGAKTRKGKRKGLAREDLMAEWKSRLSGEERAALAHTHAQKPVPAKPLAVTPGEALDFAERKLFEKDSVVLRNRLLTEALRFGVGYTTLDGIQREMKSRGYIERNVGGDDLVTTVPRVIEEAELIQKVRGSLGKLAPIHAGRIRIAREYLSKEQREAVRHILKSNDQVIALRGRAGTGKTTLLTEVREQIQAQGLRLFAFAPSAQASRKVLRDENFEGAETVARLLVDKKLQERCRGQVILIDEAGTIGIRDLARIMDIVGESTRVILSGDTGQHAPIARGDALRLLENFAGLLVATIRQIHRQEKEGYRSAIKALSEGDLKTGLMRLDEINAILEIPDDASRYQRLAADYAQCLLETGTAPLVVSPTHAEARQVTAAIRQNLADSGKLGAEHSLLQYRPLQWEEVEKERPENYAAGMTVKFHQNAKGIRRGSMLAVLGVDAAQTVWVEGPDKRGLALDLSEAGKFRVFEKAEIRLAAGDLLKITDGGTSANGKRLNNGAIYAVKKIGKDGSITLANGLVLSPGFGHVAHGYCHTSHSSQGRSVPTVFVAQSVASFLATSSEGFYVSASRGKQDLRIYTDDRISLQKAVGNSSRRLSALEFTGLGEELFVKGGLSGSEWTKRVAGERSRRQDMASHVEKLLAERKTNPQEKPVLFTRYIEARRANITADGKSRSKGHPQALQSKRQGKKGMTLPRRVDLRDSTAAKVAKPKAEIEAKAAREQAAPKKDARPLAPRIKRVGKAMENIKGHLTEVVKRGVGAAKSAGQATGRAIQFGNVKTTLGKLNGQPAQEARIERKATATPKPQPQPKPPSPPVMRRR